MIPFAALFLVLLAAHVIERVNSRRERETLLRAVELAITEGTKEREAERKERQELANRIQRPESTPIYDVPTGESQSLPYGDDDAFWEYQASLKDANGAS